MIGAIAGDMIGSRFEGHIPGPVDFELLHPDTLAEAPGMGKGCL